MRGPVAHHGIPIPWGGQSDFVRRSSTSEGGSVPTTTRLCAVGGHGAKRAFAYLAILKARDGRPEIYHRKSRDRRDLVARRGRIRLLQHDVGRGHALPDRPLADV